jgi:Ca2+/Na+ antiporter
MIHFLFGTILFFGVLYILFFTRFGRIVGGVLLVGAAILAIIAVSNNSEKERQQAQEQAAKAAAARAEEARWNALTPEAQQRVLDDNEIKQHAWRNEVPCKEDKEEIANVRRFASGLEYSYHPRVNWAVYGKFIGVAKGMSEGWTGMDSKRFYIEQESERLQKVHNTVMSGRKPPISWCPKISGKNPPQYNPGDPDPLMHYNLFQFPTSGIAPPPLPPFIYSESQLAQIVSSKGR